MPFPGFQLRPAYPSDGSLEKCNTENYLEWLAKFSNPFYMSLNALINREWSALDRNVVRRYGHLFPPVKSHSIGWGTCLP